MYRRCVIVCPSCRIDMDLEPFVSDIVPFGIRLECRNCGRVINIQCLTFGADLSESFLDSSDRPF